MMRRAIKADFDRYAPLVWAAEMGAPRIQKDAFTSWLPNFAAFAMFCEFETDEIFGFFEDDRLSFVVYLEKPFDEKRIAHFSVLKKSGADNIAAAFIDLRNDLFRRGVKIIEGFILKRNCRLRNILMQVGFVSTELEMIYGASGDKSLRWQQFQIVRI